MESTDQFWFKNSILLPVCISCGREAHGPQITDQESFNQEEVKTNIVSDYKCHEELENVFNQSGLEYMFPSRPSDSDMTKAPVPVEDSRTVDLFEMIEQADGTLDTETVHRRSSQLSNQQIMKDPDTYNSITGLGIHLMKLTHKMLIKGAEIPVHMLNSIRRFAADRAQLEQSFAEKRLTF